MKKLKLIFTLLIINKSIAQIPSLVSDFTNPQIIYNTAIIQNPVFPDGGLIFAANDGTNGLELWRSTGTPASTALVKDIYAGPNGSIISGLTPMGNFVFFSAYINGIGYELWKTDGTAGGTVMVKDIVLGSGSSHPNELKVFNNTLYFTVNDTQIWKSDGTDLGTVMVKSVFNDISEGRVNKIMPSSNMIFFSAHSESTNKNELWKSDGTEVGTNKLAEFDSIYYSDFETVNNEIYLSVLNNSSNELWKSDGTMLGTVLVKNISASNLTVFNNELYFTNSGIWKSDGTTAGTVKISLLKGTNLTKIGDALYFYQNATIVGSDVEIYKSDNTATNFTLLKILPIYNNTNGVVRFFGTGNIAYFVFGEKDFGEELWQYMPNTVSPILVKDIRPGIYSSFPQYFTYNPFNNTPDLYFVANDGTTGYELYKFSGNTQFSPTIIKDIQPNVFDTDPADFIKLNNYLFYSGNYNGERQLYLLDASTQNLNPGVLSIDNPSDFLVFNSKLYLQGQKSSLGQELCVSEGTNATTILLKDIYTGASSSSPTELTTVGSNFFFAATEATNGRELWKSDGTNAGTVLVKNIRNGTNDSSPNHLMEFNGLLYFFAVSQGSGIYQLWKSNGTDAGTTRISSTIALDEFDGEINKTTTNLFVRGNDGVNGNEIFVSNGTTISLLKNINPTGNSNPAYFTAIGNVLYFAANDGTNGSELWKTDGTSAGTVMVKDINTANVGASSNPQNLYNFNGVLYFTAITPFVGEELWKTDGTAAGTVLVKNINLDVNGSSSLSNFCTIGNTLYFSAIDPKHGREVWKTDGTDAGTVLVYDLFENYESESNSSNPSSLFNMNETLFFAANNGINGNETFRFIPCPTASTLSQVAYPKSNTLHASETISSSRKIEYGKTVNYFSGNSILLSPGFQVSANDAYSTDKNIFRAEIRGCN